MDGGLEREGDVVGSDIVGPIIGIVSAQWGGRRRIVLSEVSDPASNRMHRADKGVATEAKTDDFATDGILLSGECERHEGGSVEIILSGQGCEHTAISNIEGDVLEAERQADRERRRRGKSC